MRVYRNRSSLSIYTRAQNILLFFILYFQYLKMDNNIEIIKRNVSAIALVYRHLQRSRRIREQQFEEVVPINRRVISQIFLNRDTEGAMELLVNLHLNKYETSFIQYFRVSFRMFEYILQLVGEDIVGLESNIIPEPISPDMQLAVTLR